MKYVLFRYSIIMLIAVQTLNAQQTFRGAFSPAKNYKWALVYYQKPDGQLAFIAEGEIVNGTTKITMPIAAPKGTYRVVYGIPEDKNYFEVLYNGTENISCSFSAQGLLFTESEENKMISDYFSKMYTLENNLINYYRSGSNNSSQLKDLILELNSVQVKYENNSAGLMANHFIQANHPYIPESNENAISYIENSKDNYFNHLNLNDSVLQGSNFLNDKLFNYVFTSLPPKRLTAEQVEKFRKENISVLNEHLINVDSAFQLYVFYSLWKKASSAALNSLADYIYDKHLKPLALVQKKESLIGLVEKYNALRIGSSAPPITGDENTKSLIDLKGTKLYVLVFWNSRCPHCLEQIPLLYQKLNNNSDVKVFAVGLESDSKNWNKEILKFGGFEHSLALGELQSTSAIAYQVNKTPSYFILDAEKRFLFKPQTLKEVLDFLEVN